MLLVNLAHVPGTARVLYRGISKVCVEGTIVFALGLYGGLEFPDGEMMIDHVEDLIEFQKIFMNVVSDIREENMFTYPVTS